MNSPTHTYSRGYAGRFGETSASKSWIQNATSFLHILANRSFRNACICNKNPQCFAATMPKTHLDPAKSSRAVNPHGGGLVVLGIPNMGCLCWAWSKPETRSHIVNVNWCFGLTVPRPCKHWAGRGFLPGAIIYTCVYIYIYIEGPLLTPWPNG